MDTLAAYAMGLANKGRPLMVFDWERAARRIVECRAKNASAGLAGDWEYTGGGILLDGKPLSSDDTYVYLASTWAEPELEIDDGLAEPCWRFQDETPGWDEHTLWPPEALKILQQVDDPA